MNDSSSDLQTLVQSAQSAFDAAATPADLENAKARFLGKSGSLTDLLKGMTQDPIDRMKAKIPMGRLVQVDEIAEMAAWIASPACSFTTGFVFDITGGRATY